MSSAFSLNLQERQAVAIQAMLVLHQSRPSMRGAVGVDSSLLHSSFSSSSSSALLPQGCASWKILIFDDVAKDILGPLMTVGTLRRQGVTLNLPLKSRRSPVIEAPAVYLLAPTEENIQLLLDELQQKLYAFYFFNFTDSLSDDLMQLLAKGAVEAGMVSQVISVVERYVDFVCYSPFEFSLNKPKTFSVLNKQQSTDAEIEFCLTSIVNGIFCVIATLGAIPIIRCPRSPSSPARTVAMKLQEKILSLPQQAYSQIFPSAGGTGGVAGGGGGKGVTSSSSLYRPLLVLLDREFDLSVMIRHTWIYQALIHDLLRFKSNRVTVESLEESEGLRDDLHDAHVNTKTNSPLNPAKVKVYDLDSKDKLWIEHSTSPFPQAALAVSESLAEYNAKLQELNKSNRLHANHFDPNGNLDAADSAQGILTAVTELPGMTERKRALDAHTCIATALVDRIKSRSLDGYFEVEQSIDTDRESEALQNVKKLLGKHAPGTAIDKLRLLLTLFLNRPSLSPQHVNDLETYLKDEMGQHFPTSSLEFLRQLQRFKTSFQTPPVSSSSSLAAAGGGLSGSGSITGGGVSLSAAPTAAVASLSSTFFDKGRGLLQGVKNFLPAKKTLPIAQVIESLIENSSSNKEDANFLYIDPAPRHHPNNNPSHSSHPPHRMASPFRSAVAFVLGGGSFVESAALRELSSKLQKEIVYGSTDFVSPCDFVDELTYLGGGGGGGANGGGSF